MRSLEEFQDIILNQVGPILQKRSEKINKYARTDKGVPEYYIGYDRNVEEMNSNKVHAFATFPEKLFKNIAPNQDKAELDYLESTYQCVTSPVFLEFSNTVKRGLRNGYIEWPENSEAKENIERVKTYLRESLPQYRSLYEFMKSMVDQKLVDANGVLAIDYDFTVNDDETINELMPYPVIYHSDRVVYIGDEGSIIVIAYETSIVKEGDSEVPGYVLHGYGKNEYYYAKQTGVKKDFEFEFASFQHDLGYIPAMRMMGMPVIYENKLSFTSPFYKAVHNLNLAILDSANLLLIKRKVGYPTRVFIAQKCRNQKNGSTCKDGLITYSSGDKMLTETCDACHGTGTVGVFGPNSELLISYDENSPDNNLVKANEAMAYISPSIEIPKFLREEINRYIDEAKEILHLKAEPRQQGGITATEKNIDLKNTEAFIKPISDQIWHLYAFSLNTIGELYVGKSEYEAIKPSIRPAEEFDIVTFEDRIFLLSEAQKSGLPQFIISTIIYNLIKSISFDDTRGVKVFELIQAADRLWTLTGDQVMLDLSRGLVQRWEVVLHNSALPFIMTLASEYESTNAAPTFFDLDLSEQVTRLQNIAKANTPNTELNVEAEEI